MKFSHIIIIVRNCKKFCSFDFDCAIIVLLYEIRYPWEYSSAGRASASHAGGHGFEPRCTHYLNSVFMAVENVMDTLLFYSGICTKTLILMYNKITAH